VKELILQGVQAKLSRDRPKPRRRVKLPMVRCKKPGTLHLDNASIYELIPFPWRERAKLQFEYGLLNPIDFSHTPGNQRAD
jgi:hypothetical protein